MVTDGDENDDVANPDTSLLSDSSDVTNNVFASTYIVPKYDIGGTTENVTPIINITVSSPPQAQDITNLFSNFNSSTIHNDPDFWAVYLLSGYQFTKERDGDPKAFLNGLIITVYGAADVPPRQRTGQGAIIFNEDGRANEYPAGTVVSRASTAAHEIGHLFGCDHPDGGLMAPSATRTSNLITPECQVWIRDAVNP